MTPVHAFGDDALGDDDTVGLVERLRSGEVSATELVEAAAARTDMVNPALNGLAYEAFDRARREARAPLADRFFAGVPTFVKDTVDVAGWPTMQGTDAWTPTPKPATGDFPRMYLSTGLIALGKTQMSEFGFSGSAEHPRLRPVRNPWNPDHTAGGSSAGSAAFVAAGVVPIAHASDGAGSIRVPASCNGLVGLKPSRGRLPLDARTRRIPLRVIHNGVLTRSVRDTAAFYREAGRLWHGRGLTPIGDITRPGTRRLTFVMVTRSIVGEYTPEVRDLTLKTATSLEELGHRVDVMDTPPVPGSVADDFLLYYAFLALALVRGGRRVFGETFDRSRLDNLTLGFERHAARNLHRLPLAISRLAALRQRTAQLFRTYDAVLTPTLASPPPAIGHFDPTAGYEQIIGRLLEWVTYTPVQNTTGEPSISLPLAQSHDGLPVGMLFSAALGQEATLLELAYELEEAFPWRRIEDRPEKPVGT